MYVQVLTYKITALKFNTINKKKIKLKEKILKDLIRLAKTRKSVYTMYTMLM